MEKIPFHISASVEDRTALVRITGTIGWDTDCESFRSRMDAIAGQGIVDAHLYLNGPGGSCFDAEEIVNILKGTFKGRITGEGGAIVASAYTRIALECETFVMPENGMFMVHKPKGCACGTAGEIRSYIKLLEGIESQYFSLYTSRVSDAAELKRQWASGDWWMTAREAKAGGFITGVKGKAKIDAATAALITACGCPEAEVPIINNINFEKMDLKQMAVSLGLPEGATEAEINAAIAKGKKAQEDLQAFREEAAKREKADRKAKIKAALDKAEQDRRITADVRGDWEAILDANYESGIKALDNLPVVKKIDVIPGASASGEKTTWKGKTFAELQEEDPEALAELERNDPETFRTLFEAGRKK